MNNLNSIPHITLDEIALEGLDGITLESLWKRISIRKKFPLPLNENFCSQIWSFIAKQKCLRFYELAQPRSLIKTFDRSEGNDPDLPSPDECPFTIYKYNPIAKDNVRGSCEDYDTRKLIPNEQIAKMTMNQVEDKWDQKLCIVASQTMRESVLIPESVSLSVPIGLHQYCLLERIGRSRFNGEVTQGKHSIAEICESGNFFHYRKTLIKYRLLAKQPYVEKVSAHSTLGLLLHLPRFYCEFKPKHMILTEQVVEILKEQPNCVAEYKTLREQIGQSNYDSLRKLYKLATFQQFVHTDLKVPYRTIYPNATHSEWKIKKSADERTLRVLQLRNPNIDVTDMWPRDIEDDDENVAGFVDVSGVRLDDSLMHQAYTLIGETMSVGLTQLQLSLKLGLTKLNSRTILRNLVRLKHITSYLSDASRQRTSRYILCQYKDSLEQSFREEINLSGIDVNVDISLVPSRVDDALARNIATVEPITILDQQLQDSEDIHVSEINVSMETIDRPSTLSHRKVITDATMTVRMAKRMKIILHAIRQHLVLEDVLKMFHIIVREEKMMGYKDEMCKRSIFRLLTKLSLDKRIRLWKIMLVYKVHCKELMFIADPSVEANHTLFNSLLEKEKLRFLMRISNERSRMLALKAPTANPYFNNSNSSAGVTATAKPKPQQRKKLSHFSENLNYGNTPKFIRMRTLHEFLYYLVYAYPEPVEMCSREYAIKRWRVLEPRLTYEELEPELPPIYSVEIGWKMFVPPLMPYGDFNRGWALFCDILLRLPLSIFVKIYNINYEVPGLDAILMHPIRKHYLVSYLPIDIQNELIGGRRYIFNIDEVVRRCCAVGLMRFGPQRQKEKDQVFIYLNRHASIVNTVNSEPGYAYVSVQDYPMITYTFNSVDDITNYWHDLYRVCLSTRLGKTSNELHENMKRWDVLERLSCEWTPRPIDQVERLDEGRIPGDGRGAGGLDSTFFAHMQRNWSYKRIRYKARPAKVDRKAMNVKVKNVTRRTVAVAANRDRNRIAVVPVKRYVKPIKKLTTRTRKRVRQPNYDEVDKQALRLMRKLRVDWNPEEDNFLLLCKVAMLVLCPTHRKISVSSQQIRDILHWHLKSFDKTSRACQRRIVYMMRNEAVASNVHLCVQDINDNKEISRKFSFAIYQKLRQQIKPEDEFLRAIKILFVDLVYLLNKHFISVTTKTFDSRSIILPDTVDEFKGTFHAKPEEYTHKRLKYTHPRVRADIDRNMLTTLIHSSVCCANDKTSWSIQLYEIYKNYSENVLSNAMQKVRNDQLISANKCSNQSKIGIRNLPLSSSPYHLSITYQYMMMTKISYDNFDEVFVNVKELSDHQPLKNVPFNQLTAGRCLGFAELLYNRRSITCSISIPKQILVIDPSKYQQSDSYDRIQNRFRYIIDYIQNGNDNMMHSSQALTEYDDDEDGIKKEAAAASLAMKRKQRRVTISTSDHETIEYYVSPIEKLMKIDECFYHFYCLLQSLGTSISIAELSIDKEHLCQFDCILAHSNPVSDAIDIIKQSSGELHSISADEQLDLSMLKTCEIDVYNILVIFNILVNKRFGCDEEDVHPLDDVTDHGMLQLSLDILAGEEADAGNSGSGGGGVGKTDPLGPTEPDWFTQKPRFSDRNDADDEDLDETGVGNGKGNPGEDFAGDKIHKMHDFFFLNSCKLSINAAADNVDDVDYVQMADSNAAVQCGDITVPREIFKLNADKKAELLEWIPKNVVWSKIHGEQADFIAEMGERGLTTEQTQFGLNVLGYLEKNEDLGATNVDIVAKFGDKQLLLVILDILADLKLIMKTGVSEVTFVHWMYVTPWLVTTYHIKRLERDSLTPLKFKLMKIENPIDDEQPSTSRKRKHSDTLLSTMPERSRQSRFKRVTINQNAELPLDSQPSSKPIFHLQMLPWIRINGSLNRRVLDKWMGVILMYCISHAGVTLLKVATRFNLMQPMHVRILLEYLQYIECVILKSMTNVKSQNLWSTYESPQIAPTTDLDPMDTVFIEVQPDAITKMSMFIGEKKYTTEFI